MLSPAPLANDLARGPAEASGHWVQTPDGLRDATVYEKFWI